MICRKHRILQSVARWVTIAALLGATSVAQGQQAVNPADLKAIQNCIKKSYVADGIGTTCIGLVADPCRAKAENDTAKTQACAERELRVWNRISEEASKRVRAGGFKDIVKAMADSEKAWVQQRDALCPVFDKVEPGSLPGDAAYCRMQTTANRALLLLRLGDAVNER